MDLIIPCAGKSTRFGFNKPKYLLTHPDGKLMIQKSIEGLDLDQFNRVIITIISDDLTGYNAKLILDQIYQFDNNPKFELCVLDEYTLSQSETVYKTLVVSNVNGSFAVKDSDNKLGYEPKVRFEGNFVFGLNVNQSGISINRLQSKSFLKINDQNIITNIIEKSIVSDYICVGLYGFREASVYKKAFEAINISSKKELYISHIISYLIMSQNEVFYYQNSIHFEDYGTKDDWSLVQSKLKTYFVDFDGVTVKNKGKYGLENWATEEIILKDNIEILRRLSNDGAQIIVTTSRPNEYREEIINLLESHSIKIYYVICGLNHSQRVLINDFYETNPYPSAVAISIRRNGDLSEYLK